MKKLFASDLDGTLLNAEHEQDEVILSGLKKILEDGNVFVVATGRSPSMLDGDLLPGAWFVAMNGAILMNPEREVETYFPIAKESLAWMTGYENLPLEFNTPKGILVMQDSQSWLASRSEEKKVFKAFNPEKLMKGMKFGCTREEILEADVVKVNLLKTPDSSLFLSCVEADKNLVNAPSMPHLVEITAAGVNKASGIQLLADRFGVDASHIYVYGDGGNDVAMLEAFEHSHCPCTGFDVAKAAAKETIGPYDEHSVILHMVEKSASE